AAEQRGDLRRRLSLAEVARDQAQTELAAAEQRIQVGLQREQELQTTVDAFVGQAAASSKQEAPRRVSAGGAIPPLNLSGLQMPGASGSRIEDEETYVEGVGMLMTPRPGRGAPTAATPPTKSRASRPSQGGRNSMPMDFRSLGNLLSGGGILGGKKR
ncbi:unnamed protein product, partial [Polarella glacialis]